MRDEAYRCYSLMDIQFIEFMDYGLAFVFLKNRQISSTLLSRAELELLGHGWFSLSQLQYG